MRRIVVAIASLVLLWGAGLPAASPGNSSDARKAWRGLLGRVEPRTGLHHRSLVLVPLVLKTPMPAETLPVATSGLAWRAETKGKKKPVDAVTITWAAKAAALTGNRLLPSGLLLRRGDHEQMLLRPTLLMAGAEVKLRTVSLMRAGAPRPAADAPRTFGGVAPPEFGHTAFLAPGGSTLGHLVALEAVLLGVDTDQAPATLERILRAPKVARKVAAAVTSLRPVGKAYGGETVGHVAYLGNRPVQLVLARAPGTYATYVSEAVAGLALSVVAWEELYARSGLGVPAPSWPRYLAHAETLLEDLGHVTARPERRADERGTAGELWRMRATKGRRGGKPGDAGWLLLDADGRAVWLEAWPTGTVGPLPKPATSPGGADEGDDPDGIKQGALTRPFLERFYKRLKELGLR